MNRKYRLEQVQHHRRMRPIALKVVTMRKLTHGDYLTLKPYYVNKWRVRQFQGELRHISQQYYLVVKSDHMLAFYWLQEFKKYLRDFVAEIGCHGMSI